MADSADDVGAPPPILFQKAAERPRGAPGKPFVKGDIRAGRPKGWPNAATLQVREMCREIVENAAYRASLIQRLEEGTCSPPVETMIWHYAYGKPKEMVELTGADGGPIQIAAASMTTAERASRARELLELAGMPKAHDVDAADDDSDE